MIKLTDGELAKGDTTATLALASAGKVAKGELTATQFKALFTLDVTGSTTDPVWQVKKGDGSYEDLGSTITLDAGAILGLFWTEGA